eukprot:scaffold212094_cov40-Tisochrysis_lutea.AAC.6
MHALKRLNRSIVNATKPLQGAVRVAECQYRLAATPGEVRIFAICWCTPTRDKQEGLWDETLRLCSSTICQGAAGPGRQVRDVGALTHQQ